MAKSYCLRQKKMTEDKPGSEQIVTTRNGRNMMKSICAECGARKSKFIKGTSGKGLILGKNSPFKNIPVLGAIL